MRAQTGSRLAPGPRPTPSRDLEVPAPLRRLSIESILSRSGFEVSGQGRLRDLRDGYYVVVDKAITGDAPKDFIRVYEYGTAKRDNPRKWPAHIAKVGHKWYPNESITEHLLTRIGQLLGVRMAESKLMLAHGQIRFLSRYFLRAEQSLVHGAQIFASYLEDEAFVDAFEKDPEARDHFTFQFVAEAIRARFPDQAPSILNDFTRMLAFDAIVGNNDRHHYNWGVVVHARGAHEPYFAPVYDTARALFWNDPESKLQAVRDDRNPDRRAIFLSRYVKDSRPKTGWEGAHGPDHYTLIRGICQDYPDLRQALADLCRPNLLQQTRRILNSEFLPLMSALRRDFILDCLARRLEQYCDTVTEAIP